MLSTLGVLLAIVPSAALLAFFYWKDRYEPEPYGHILAAVALGALATVPILCAQEALAWSVGSDWLLIGGLPARLFEAGVMAAVVEEAIKWMLFAAVIYRWRELDEPMDGVVYGVALALGFATVENVMFIRHAGEGALTLGLLRALFSVPAHALFGGAMGSFFGRAKLGGGLLGGADVTPRQRKLRLALAFAVPCVYHFGYDGLLLTLRRHEDLMFGVVGGLSIVLWIFVLRRVDHALADSPFKDP